MPRIHIILADDDEDDCLIFTQVATDVSPKVRLTCLHDCESLLRFLEASELPQVVFLDLNMPVLSGQDCLKRIKARLEWKDIPIIVYSTASRKEIIEECYKLGASLYVVKPSNVKKLEDTITWIIQKFVHPSN